MKDQKLGWQPEEFLKVSNDELDVPRDDLMRFVRLWLHVRDNDLFMIVSCITLPSKLSQGCSLKFVPVSNCKPHVYHGFSCRVRWS